MRTILVALLAVSSLLAQNLATSTVRNNRLQSGASLKVTTTSSSPTVYTGTMAPAITAYTSGMVVNWSVSTSCTGGVATTLNINGLGAKAVKQYDGSTDPTAAQCPNGALVQLGYDGTLFRILSSSTGGITSVFTRSGAVVAMAGDYTATQITNTPAGAIAATTVQAAINELDTEKAAVSHAHAAADTTSGTFAAARLPNPGVGSKGGVESLTCSGTDKISAINTSGLPVCSTDQNSGGGDTLALPVTRTSSTVLTIGTGCAAATPCNVGIGSKLYTFTASQTATIAANGGTAYIYINASGALVVGYGGGTFASGNVSCSGGATCTFGVTSFPIDAIKPLYTWTAASATWDTSGGSDKRAALSKPAKAITAGSGISFTEDDDEIQINATGGGSGTVTSVDASGGVETASGSAITASGSVRGTHLVNAQTGTSYTIVTGDRGKLVTFTNGSAIAVTLPQAGGTFPHGWYMWVQNRGAGTVTITPTTSTVDGSASIALTTAQGVLITSDGTNYFTMRGMGSAGGGGSPGGSGTEIQYRNGGSFGAVTGSSVSGGNITIVGSITGGANGRIQLSQGGAGGGLVSASDSLSNAFSQEVRTGTDSAVWQMGAPGVSGIWVYPRGAVQWVPTGSKYTCNSTYRGTIWYTPGGAGVADSFEVCRKDASDVYAWVALY